MKIKEKIFTLINIIIGILLIYESFTLKSISSKVSIVIVILMFLVLLFTKKITLKEQKNYIFLIGYVIIYTFNKIFKYDIRFVINSLLIIAKIFSFPVIIYCIIKLFKNIKKEYINKIFVIGSTIISILLLIIMFISNNYAFSNILFIILFTLHISLNKSEIKYKYIPLVLTIILSIILNNQITLLFSVILCIIDGYKNFKEKKNIYLYISVLLLIFSTSFLVINEIKKNDTTDYKYSNINKEYEMYINDININNLGDIPNIYKYYSLSDILFGIDYYNVNDNNMSIVYIASILGIVGLFIYVILWVIVIRNINNKFEFLILLLYLLISNLLLEPVVAFVLSLFILINLKEFNDNNECLYNKKTILLIFLVIVFSLSTSYIMYYVKNNIKTTEEIVLKIDDKLNVSNKYNLRILDNVKKENDGVIEDLTYYELKSKNRVLAEIVYVKRSISDVTIEYITFNNKSNKLNIKLEVSNNNLNEIINFNDYNVDFPYSYVVGQNKLKLPIGYYKNDKYNMIIGRSIEYNVLSINYDKENKSTIYNLVDQKVDLENNYKNIEINPNNSVDTYIIKSQKELFENENSVKEFLNIINNNSSWLRYSGNLYKVQYSIEPFTRDGYGKMLSELIEKDIYYKSLVDNNIIYKALVQSSLFSLYNYTARTREDGVFLTDYTSTWLSDDYNTKAYYVDTRYNETIGYHLLNVYNSTKNDKYLNSFLEYANFIVDEWNSNSTYMINNIKMLPDYFSDSNLSKPHSSLNHQLALVNYLFKAYQTTNDKVYLKTAEEMLENIIKFDEKWIRENGDLWYQVNSKGEFSEEDYEFVTLDDLLFTQNYLFEIKNETSDVISLYIKSKVSYLNNKGLTLTKFEKDLISKLNIII